MKRSAVFSCMGLGDGMVTLVLSHNLRLKGEEVVTFHPFLAAVQRWFPDLPLRPFPEIEELDQFDKFFIIYEKSPWMQEVISTCEAKFPEKTFILNPIATPKRDYRYWEVGQFDGRLPFVENLRRFCERTLDCPAAEASNGITVPSDYTLKKYPKRVVIHPTSSRPGKNWPQESFLDLAARLEKDGFEPVFMLTPEEKVQWQGMSFSAPDFASLDERFGFIAESGSMIGNDSGIGHLASCLGLPTVTICRSKMTADFWRPAWSPNTVLLPPQWLPNIKGLRLRDKYWKQSIRPSRVLSAFKSMCKNGA